MNNSLEEGGVMYQGFVVRFGDGSYYCINEESQKTSSLDSATVFPDVDKWFSYVSFSDKKLPRSDYVVNILQVAKANEPVAEIIRVQYGTANVQISED
jgi:hypothetical protein